MSREIYRSTRYKRDYKRESKGRFAGSLEEDLRAVLSALIANDPLPVSARDHLLTGEWIGHRDCHVKPHLILIYRLPDEDTLELVRLGSHSQLGL